MRREFPKPVKVEAHLRAKGCCELCGTGIKLRVGDIFYDHRIADGLGGEPTLENCQVLCRSHHDAKTRGSDVPTIAKVKRIRNREAGIKKPRTITGWRSFKGERVYAPRER
jgi:5-methylcytosine-specific restriction protein A